MQTRRVQDNAADRPLFLTREGAAIRPAILRATLQRRGLQVGLRVYPHLLRHSAAIEYLRGGGRVEVLKVLLGHSTLAMSLHFARIAGIDVEEAHHTADPNRRRKTRV